ncbi:uncharacterized protein LOC143109617 isoform X2 [Alosa pseudoharengus]|uniref:uncharacterized protein LOC143109617 isoform X2 n=1 Tax=Alosa pseudoharengus TaxID=34774 RepID=UPI003F8ADBB6
MKPVKIFVTQSGNTLNSHNDFLKRLRHHRKIQEKEVHECDVILAFCPIVSRVGTDIEAALKIFKGYSTPSKPIIVVVLHHTYERDEVVPDSNKYANEKICIVNSLFHESEGLLKNCKQNSDAINLTSQKLKDFKKNSKGPEKNKEAKAKHQEVRKNDQQIPADPSQRDRAEHQEDRKNAQQNRTDPSQRKKVSRYCSIA